MAAVLYSSGHGKEVAGCPPAPCNAEMSIVSILKTLLPARSKPRLVGTYHAQGIKNNQMYYATLKLKALNQQKVYSLHVMDKVFKSHFYGNYPR